MVLDLVEVFQAVRLEYEGETTPVDRESLEKLKAPLVTCVRNARDSRIEPRRTAKER